MKFKMVVLGLFFYCGAFAQQTEQFTHYMLNKYHFNSAYAGLDNSLSITTSYRSQWDPISGNPKQYSLNAHLPFYIWSGALGVSLYNETLGVENNTAFKFSYNYIYKSVLGLFSSSISLGIKSKSINGAEIITPEGIYNTSIEHNDPILSNSTLSGMIPTWSLAFYLVNDFFEAGFSTTDLITPQYQIGDFSYTQSKNFNVFFQSAIYIGEELELLPSLLVKTNLKLFQTDIGIIGNYRDIIGGINFRGFNKQSQESFGIIIGTKLNRKFTISYSFDSTIGALKTISEGTHEILLNYNLQKLIGFGLPPKIIYNPRNL